MGCRAARAYQSREGRRSAQLFFFKGFWRLSSGLLFACWMLLFSAPPFFACFSLVVHEHQRQRAIILTIFSPTMPALWLYVVHSCNTQVMVLDYCGLQSRKSTSEQRRPKISAALFFFKAFGGYLRGCCLRAGCCCSVPPLFLRVFRLLYTSTSDNEQLFQRFFHRPCPRCGYVTNFIVHIILHVHACMQRLFGQQRTGDSCATFDVHGQRRYTYARKDARAPTWSNRIIMARTKDFFCRQWLLLWRTDSYRYCCCSCCTDANASTK